MARSRSPSRGKMPAKAVSGLHAYQKRYQAAKKAHPKLSVEALRRIAKKGSSSKRKASKSRSGSKRKASR
jgi:hypothetical protein